MNPEKKPVTNATRVVDPNEDLVEGHFVVAIPPPGAGLGRVGPFEQTYQQHQPQPQLPPRGNAQDNRGRGSRGRGGPRGRGGDRSRSNRRPGSPSHHHRSDSPERSPPRRDVRRRSRNRSSGPQRRTHSNGPRGRPERGSRRSRSRDQQEEDSREPQYSQQDDGQQDQEDQASAAGINNRQQNNDNAGAPSPTPVFIPLAEILQQNLVNDFRVYFPGTNRGQRMGVARITDMLATHIGPNVVGSDLVVVHGDHVNDLNDWRESVVAHGVNRLRQIEFTALADILDDLGDAFEVVDRATLQVLSPEQVADAVARRYVEQVDGPDLMVMRAIEAESLLDWIGLVKENGPDVAV